MTEKRGGEDFDAEDERALILLAAQAGVAIENAHLHEQAQDRAAAGGGPGHHHGHPGRHHSGEILGLVVGHARELVGADLATLALPAGPTSW